MTELTLETLRRTGAYQRRNRKFVDNVAIIARSLDFHPSPDRGAMAARHRSETTSVESENMQLSG